MDARKYSSLVNKATDESLLGEDWDTNSLIWDLLKKNPDEAAPAILTSITERLQNKNPKIQQLALSVSLR